MSTLCRNLKHCVDLYTSTQCFHELDISQFSQKRKGFGMLLSVSKWRRILRGKTETKSAPKTIFSGNGNGLKEFYTRTKECPHSVCKTRLRAFVYEFKPGTLTIEGQQTPVGVESPVLFCVQNQ